MSCHTCERANIPHVNESCHTREWVVSHTFECVMRHVRARHVADVNESVIHTDESWHTHIVESCHTCGRVTSECISALISSPQSQCSVWDAHLPMRHDTYARVVSHIRTSRCHPHEWAMSHPCNRVLSHIRTSHVSYVQNTQIYCDPQPEEPVLCLELTHINKSWHIGTNNVTHRNYLGKRQKNPGYLGCANLSISCNKKRPHLRVDSRKM